MKKMVFLFSVLFAAQATAQSAAPTSVQVDLSAATAMAAAAHEGVENLQAAVAELEKKLSQAQSRGVATSALKVELKMRKGALTRAQLRLSTVMAERDAAKAALQKAELDEARGEAEQKRLDALLTAGQGGMEVWQSILPTEDPVMGMVRKTCPPGTAPEFVRIGGNTRFSCESVLSAPALLLPAKEEGEKEALPSSKYLTCLPWAAVGGIGGGAGNYGAVRAFDRGVDGKIAVATGVAGGAAVLYGICLLTSE